MKDSRKKFSIGSDRWRWLCLGALFAAAVYVATGVLPRIPMGVGYVHIGDAVVYLAAVLLPHGYAACAAAIGAGLADLTSGYAIWIPATVVIKALTVLFFTRRRAICKKNFLALLAAAALCVGGYFLWEAIVYRSIAAPLVSLGGNLLQAACSAVLFLIVGAFWDRSRKGNGEK